MLQQTAAAILVPRDITALGALAFADWQKVLALQMVLARAVAEPDEP